MHDTGLEKQVLGKVTRRLIPFMFLIYIFNFLDRTNVSVAALTMKGELGFSDAVYGLGAGIFFLGYFLFEVPSNLILARVGARRWIARIMVTWGIISAGMMFVTTPATFYTMRFLLGVAEAGFFPGMILYLSYWFPAAERARAVSRFMTAVPLAAVIGGPLSASLLTLDGWGGLKGWQWLFLVEGVPSILLSVVTLLVLTDRPSEARWLHPEERDWLIARLQREQETRVDDPSHSLWRVVAHPMVLLLCLLYFIIILCGYGVSFWAPLILKSRSNWSDPTISVVGALPQLAGAIGMVAIAARSDRTGEHARHAAFAAVLAMFGFLILAAAETSIPTLLGAAVVTLGIMGAMGPLWALSSDVTSGRAAAVGIAAISSVGNLGGFLGPTAMGAIKGATHGFSAGLYALAASMLVAALLSLAMVARTAPRRNAASAVSR